MEAGDNLLGRPSHQTGGRRRKTMHSEENTEAVTLEAILSEENLKTAWLAVKANQGAPGVDGRDIEETEEHLKKHWEAIRRKLLEGIYQPGAVREVEIPKPNGGSRKLGIPNVQDRMIQQAIHQKLSPEWEKDFSEHSYGFRPNRGAQDAIRAAQGYIQAGKTWVVDIDLKSYFDEVDHDILMREIKPKIGDKRLLRLIGEYLRAPMQAADRSKTKRMKGTPQGGPLSPLLANIYLDPLDKELESRGLSFVRYADDIAIFASSERAAERILERVIQWIETNLKVPVNREKSGSGPTDKSALLGFRLHADGSVGMSPKTVVKLKAKVRELWDAQQSRTSEELRENWRQYIQGWWNYFGINERPKDLQRIGGWIRRHIRKCFWIRWKTPKGRLNALRRLGVKGRSLGLAYTGIGAWAMAKHPVLQQAMKNNTLNKYGFIVPWELMGAKA